MTSHAPAQTVEVDGIVAVEVEAIQSEGKRPSSKKLDLTDPRTINKEVVVALARVVSPETIGKKIKEMLDMTRPTRYGPAPDVRAMEAGVKLWLAYTAGLPLQRQEIVSVNVDADSAMGLEDRLAHSPALMAMMESIIARVKSRKAGGNVEQSSQNNGSEG